MCIVLQGVTPCGHTLLHSAQRPSSLPAASTSPHHQPPLCASPPPPTTNLPCAPALHQTPPTSSLRRPSTTHQELHPTPPIHPCNLAPKFTPPGLGRPPGLTRTLHFPAGRQRRGRLTYNQKTALTSWFSLTSTQTQVLSVKRGMTASVSQIWDDCVCFTDLL